MKPREIIRLSIRNLSRHRRRTIITAGAVAVGLALFVIVDSLLLGVEQESTLNLIRYETGAAQVLREEYLDERDDRPLKYAIDDPERIEKALEESGLSATSRVVFTGEMVVFKDPFPEDGSVVVTGYGIDPDDDNDVYRLPESVTQGEYLSSDSNGALLGAWLAEDVGAEVGYPITIVTRTRQGYYQTIDLEIVGIVNTPNPIINRNAVFIPKGIVDDYLQMDGAATEIAVADRIDASLNEITATMRMEIAGAPDLVVADWRTLAAEVVAIAEAKDSGTGIILFFVFVIAAVGVSNTVLMSILERTRELGMMRAMGMRDREVMATLLVEAAGIGVLGGIVGVVVGAGGVAALVEFGIDYGTMMRNNDVGYRVTQVIYGAWNIPAFGRAIVVGIVIAVVTAFVPVRRALKMDVVDSLRAQ
jgi:putative ABC transport system permease protein